ncbi:MAG: DUF2231 domain-containing protein [Candidatus Velamenicoccus archaeovorus]
MARLFSVKAPLTLRGRKFHGIRGWAGKPTHPPLTDFPIVCYVLAAVFDVVSFVGRGGSDGTGYARDFFVAGTYVIVAGGIVSLGTAITGFWDWWKGVERQPTGPIGRAGHTQVWRTINTHMTIMLTVTAIVLADIVVRLAGFDDGSAGLGVMILSVLAGGLVAIGATYGGSLVFDHQFNVESLSFSTAWDETEVDQTPADKAAAKAAARRAREERAS